MPWARLINRAARVGHVFRPQSDSSVLAVLANSRFINANGLFVEHLPKRARGLMPRQLMQCDPSRGRQINIARSMASQGLGRLNLLVILNLKPINRNDLIGF